MKQNNTTMKRLSYLSAALFAIMLAACSSEDDLTPKVDTSNEYATYIMANKDRTPTDSLIYEWLTEYNTYIVYNFRDNDIKWQWSGKMNISYTPYDPESESDMNLLMKHLNLVKTAFFDNYETDFLRQSLPYKLFFVKSLKGSGFDSFGEASYTALSNSQDAILIAYLQPNGRAYSQATMESEMSGIFGGFFYDKLDVKPLKFLNSRVPVNYDLVTTPADPKVEAELAIKPDFANQEHDANVCGYVKAYLPTHVRVPTEVQDFTDYLWFITQNKGSWIRQRTQFYKRLAQRGSYFIEFYQEVLGQDLIAQQNRKFPNDPVTIDDFKWQ